MIGGASMWNIEDFTNHATGVISLGGNFYNGDTLNFDASFVNDGSVEIAMSWFNVDDVSGDAPGYFIVQDSTANLGSMTGAALISATLHKQLLLPLSLTLTVERQMPILPGVLLFRQTK
jgi:hypothetical protein